MQMMAAPAAAENLMDMIPPLGGHGIIRQGDRTVTPEAQIV
jgi:hypothetical protein